jgi:hypothetical protein
MVCVFEMNAFFSLGLVNASERGPGVWKRLGQRHLRQVPII